MTQETITTSKEETIRLGSELGRKFSGGLTVALSGDLGAGKTTLTQGILEELGVEGPYTSPTFVIMKQYDIANESSKNIRRIYHVDAYRIGSKELLSLGWEEWTQDPLGVVLVEWPERVSDILPDEYISISIEWINETNRKIRIEDKENRLSR